MANEQYTHLHAHSTYSIDAISTPRALIQTAINNGQNAIAITDHGEMSSVVDFVSTAADFPNFKPIIGCELYVDYGGEITHMTALADGVKGYNNLVRILNAGVQRSVSIGKNYRQHPTTIDDLIAHNEDVILLTGCPKSLFQYNATSNQEAVNELIRLKTHYGDRIFAEGMLSSDDEQMVGSSTARAILLSERCGIQLVITNDVHFAEKYQQPAHSFHVMNRMGFKYPDDELYLKSALEMQRTILSSPLDIKDKKRLLDAMQNSFNLSQKIRPVTFDGKPQLPYIAQADDEFTKAVWAGYANICLQRGGDYPELKQRLEYEVKIIVDKGFPTYFLLTQEMVRYAKDNGHKVGVGRGSAAGSAVAYVLGITGLNPLEYDLIFERFLNPDRAAMPDIDVDYSESGRKQVIDYVSNKYKGVPIGTQSYYGHRVLVNDLARFFKIPDDIKSQLLEDESLKVDAWLQVQRTYPDFLVIYQTLVNESIRHQSKHAGGLLILPEELEYEIPLTIAAEVAVSSLSEGTHGQDLSSAGGVKFDVLGVRTLDALQELERTTGVKPPEIGAHDYNDCFELIERNEVDGVFQLGGSAARQYATQYKPKSIDEIAAVTALARTGAKDSGAADAFLKLRVSKPMVRALPPYDSGDLYDIVTDNDSSAYYGHWEVKTNCGWVKITDLDESIHKIIMFM